MLYIEACPTNRTLERSLEFPFTRTLMKIFRTRYKDTVTECSYYFGLQSIADLIKSVNCHSCLKLCPRLTAFVNCLFPFLCVRLNYSRLSEFILAQVCLYFVLVVSYCQFFVFNVLMLPYIRWIKLFSAVAVLGTFAHTIPEDEM